MATDLVFIITFAWHVQYGMLEILFEFIRTVKEQVFRSIIGIYIHKYKIIGFSYSLVLLKWRNSGLINIVYAYF